MEITFSSAKELHDFKLTKENLAWIETLSYVTIHAPFSLFASNKQETITEQLGLIHELYRRINAGNVIVHPGRLEDMAMLNRIDFNDLNGTLSNFID